MTKHELKSWPEYFEPIFNNIKRFELRKNDRNFQVGDIIWLREWDKDNGYTGRSCKRRVTYMLEGIQDTSQPYWGLDQGYAILSLEDWA